MADRGVKPEVDLVELLGERDAQVVHQALFALQRERTAAYNAVRMAALMRGDVGPDSKQFDLDVVPTLARRFRAAPIIL